MQIQLAYYYSSIDIRLYSSYNQYNFEYTEAMTTAIREIYEPAQSIFTILVRRKTSF